MNETPNQDERRTHNSDPADSHAGTRVLTDGGEEIRSYRDVKRTRDAVRDYAADGTLFAYRDGDEHVVVSEGNDRGDRWTKRVPAERTTVDVGDHLWTIPENWTHRLSIRGAGTSRYALYHIPETDCDVRVSVPNKVHLCDAWYGVKDVGTAVVEWDDELDRDALRQLRADCADSDVVDSDVLSVLDRIDQQWDWFDELYRETANEIAWDVFWDGPDTNDGWTREAATDHIRIDEELSYELDLDQSLASEVDSMLKDAGVIPYYQTYRVSVEEQ